MATDPLTIDAYNKNAEKYDKLVKDPEDSLYRTYYETPAMRAEFPPLKGLKVISIACGSDEDAIWFIDNRVSKLVGIDISEKLIEIAKKNNPTGEYHVMDMENLKFEDDSFDFAYSSLAIEYSNDWLKVLKEVYRILKPGSLFVFSCNHPIETASQYFKNDKKHGSLLGRVTDDKTRNTDFYGDYLASTEGGIRQTEGFLPGAVTYHRPISKMLEDIIASGFSLRKLIEPLPSKEMETKYPDKYEKLIRIPVFIIWVLQK